MPSQIAGMFHHDGMTVATTSTIILFQMISKRFLLIFYCFLMIAPTGCPRPLRTSGDLLFKSLKETLRAVTLFL